MNLNELKFLTDKNEYKSFSDYDAKEGYILYFYPKAMTPGCTLETIKYNQKVKFFKEYGFVVFGISRDKPDVNNKFSCKHELDFDLICDVDDVLTKNFNVLKEKSMFGKKYLGIERSTFVLNKSFKILKEMRKVSPVEHIEEVANFVVNNKG